MGEYVKYLDESLSFEERARDLVSRMTLKECAGQLLHGAAAVERLGVPEYNWWNEALHGVARAGMATVFPQAIGMAASFDKELLKKVADRISTEGRAKYNEYKKRGARGIYQGITFWSPNVNLFRDPRWGRGQETYGEDPFLTAELGTAFVEGLQGDDPRYLKTAGCAKHFAVHSGPEPLRHEFDAKASKKDMEETYLPQFEALCKAGVAGFMGAYNRVNGEPACGSRTLLQDILRKKWGFKGYVTSDCWAINDFHANHKVTKNPCESVKLALENGCSLNCGCTYEYVQMAVDQGLVSEQTVREAVEVLMTIRMRLGMFDKETPWDSLSEKDVDTDEAKVLNERMARESLVLLKNTGILPLDRSRLQTIAVIGPNAASVKALEGNYHGVANEYHTVLDGIRQAFPEGKVLFCEGCTLRPDVDKNAGIYEAQAVIDQADIAVIVTGLDETIEGEEGMGGPSLAGDKPDLLLPEEQRALIRGAAACRKPVIIVNMMGSAVDFSEEGELADAIIQAWYPGAMGGKAVADLLFGMYSPSGRLPVTFYKNDAVLPEFTDYSMKNRTYKYCEDTPLYPFGYGLSYSSFVFTDLKAEGRKISVDVENQGPMDAGTVVQFYVKDLEASTEVPKYRLGGFRHVDLEAGEKKTVTVSVPESIFMIVTDEGERIFEPGVFRIYAGDRQPDERSRELAGTDVLSIDITL